ncbi:hypothetical protein CONCODRAFT_72899 [Conidiobolus coronatus NRRL 28638]|uniref:Uncharacterized protein n=1 Tax=Conidiobolus coronatus (strain ATCC 28846 / CBS 209.66 / NRRL 28638) TaxID=796925 RepID=A0A137NY72_CONC2|nr:hypothetical protein CONCODRAFT_72899 [Conidiobolus coronatus NRRL 28638]|eukprot:KXN67549.1 hypothetical protein CONCODRAFT_72899 [Conidiobolus coronatus NRRL 28638]
MTIHIPILSQTYDSALAKVIAYNLIQESPIIISYSIEKISAAKSCNLSITWLNRIIPPWSNHLNKYYIESNDVEMTVKGIYSLCKRLVQFLLWTKHHKAKDLGEINGYDYEIELDKTPVENICLIQLFIESHCYSLVPLKSSLKSERNESTIKNLNTDQVEYIFKNFPKSLLSESIKKQILKELNLDLNSKDLDRGHSKTSKYNYKYIPEKFYELKSSIKHLKMQILKTSVSIKKH